MEKNIFIGQVERSHFFGKLRRWEPLELPWKICCSHLVARAEYGANWLGLVANIVESVLKNNGRVLIVDRRAINHYEEETTLEYKDFHDTAPFIMNNLEDKSFMKNFLDHRKRIQPEKSFIVIPSHTALQYKDGTFVFNKFMAECIDSVFSGKGDLVDSIPILIITIGLPWYSKSSFVPTKLRNLSVASFHVLTFGNEINYPISQNSMAHIFLFPRKTEDKNSGDGFIRFFEESSKDSVALKEVNTLFKLT
jgi:hypothetical protein